jgi:hypothetical protein
VALESDLENTRQLHGQAVQAAEQAKQAVGESERRLRETLAQEDQLLLQATQAEMQHRTAESMTSMEGIGGGGNSPTFEEIRNKIENRYTTALGKQELAEATGATSAAQLDAAALTRESEGRSKLEQIRASMGIESGGAAGAGRQLTEGQGASVGDPAGANVNDDDNDDKAADSPGAAATGGTTSAEGGASGPTLPRDTRE